MKPNAIKLPIVRLTKLQLAQLCGISITTCLLFPSTPAVAVDFGDRTPSVGQLIEALNKSDEAITRIPAEGETTGAKGVRTRGIKIVTHPPGLERRLGAQGSNAPAGGKVSMVIQFALNSDRVLQGSAHSLHNLASALMSEVLKDRRFEVIGHTDVTGPASFNLTLSRRRAQSVAEFLSSVGVDRSRASTSGHGSTELLSNVAPESAWHRRVEIRIIN